MPSMVKPKKSSSRFFQVERFREKKSGVDREDREVEPVLPCEVHHDKTGPLKTGANAGARTEVVPGPAENVLGGIGLEPLVERFDVRCGEHD